MEELHFLQEMASSLSRIPMSISTRQPVTSCHVLNPGLGRFGLTREHGPSNWASHLKTRLKLAQVSWSNPQTSAQLPLGLKSSPYKLYPLQTQWEHEQKLVASLWANSNKVPLRLNANPLLHLPSTRVTGLLNHVHHYSLSLSLSLSLINLHI